MTDHIAQNIREMFLRTNSYRYSRASAQLENSLFSHFIEVNTTTSSFEIPLFLMNAFCDDIINICKTKGGVRLVSPLMPMDSISRYSSIPNLLSKAVFRSPYVNERLMKVHVPKTDIIYYGTQGALFKSDMTPIFMASWELRRYPDSVVNGSSECTFDIIRPIVRIAPEAWLDKTDTVQRFLVGKLTKAFLEDDILVAPTLFPYLTAANGWNRRAKIILEPMPFTISSAKVPSISTSQQSLKDVVLQNISDLHDILRG